MILEAPALPYPNVAPLSQMPPDRLVRCGTGMFVSDFGRCDGPAVPVHPVLSWYYELIH